MVDIVSGLFGVEEECYLLVSKVKEVLLDFDLLVIICSGK